MAFTVLLFSAAFIELHNFHNLRIIEIRHGGVIKSDVPILAHAEATEINRLRGEQIGVAVAFLDGLGCVAAKSRIQENRLNS